MAPKWTKLRKKKFFGMIKNFMGNLLMVKFPLHAELQNSRADQTLMSKFTTTVDKNDMEKSIQNGKSMSRVLFQVPLQKIWADSHSMHSCKLMGNLPFSNYYRQYNSNYVK